MFTPYTSNSAITTDRDNTNHRCVLVCKSAFFINWQPQGRLRMLRVALKFPYNGQPRILRYSNSKFHVSAKYLQARGHEGGRGKGGGKFLFVLGTVTLVSGATVAYAKNDPEFRKWLAKNVPYSDEFIKVVLQEEKPFYDSINDYLSGIRTQLWKMIFGKEAKPKQRLKEDEKTEICEDIIEKKDYKPSDKKPENDPKSLVELEKSVADAAKLAVEAYREAACACREHGKEINNLVEESVENLDSKIWTKLKSVSEKKDKSLALAEEHASVAKSNLDKLRSLLEDSNLKVPDTLKDAAKDNLMRIQQELEAAKREFAVDQSKAGITERYWKKVEQARKHFAEELEAIFPSIRIADRSLKLAEGEIDLFIFHAYRTILYYQKELQKLEIASEERLQKVLDESGGAIDKAAVEAQVQAQLEKERRQLDLEYQRKILSLQAEAEKELRLQLKRQAEAHSDHLRDVMATHEMELARQLRRKADEKIFEEQAKYKQQLASMIGRLKGLETTLREQAEAEKSAAQAQLLWSSAQTLYTSLRAGRPGVPWCEQLRPLEGEVLAVKKAAVKGDELVQVVVAGIPQEAMSRGIYPEDALRERFLKVERVAQRLALLPETGGSLPMYLLSYLQSFLLINAVNPIPQAELADEPVDISSLDTYDILQRARYWLDRGNFRQTLRYMNLLKGASRKVASDWMNETRILLETQQAANTLLAHAAAIGLVHM